MKTEIAKLGKVAFQQRLLAGNSYVGDDAAVIDRGDYLELITQGTMFEGVDFDLSYFPLTHLGYKAVVGAISNIYAMNGLAEYITVSLGLSRRFSVEDVEQIYIGINRACDDYGIELVGGNTSASLT
ncbi:MAG: AIR synthase related protein, partial [Rikenellaceae bacterium]